MFAHENNSCFATQLPSFVRCFIFSHAVFTLFVFFRNQLHNCSLISLVFVCFSLAWMRCTIVALLVVFCSESRNDSPRLHCEFLLVFFWVAPSLPLQCHSLFCCLGISVCFFCVLFVFVFALFHPQPQFSFLLHGIPFVHSALLMAFTSFHFVCISLLRHIPLSLCNEFVLSVVPIIFVWKMKVRHHAICIQNMLTKHHNLHHQKI